MNIAEIRRRIDEANANKAINYRKLVGTPQVGSFLTSVRYLSVFGNPLHEAYGDMKNEGFPLSIQALQFCGLIPIRSAYLGSDARQKGKKSKKSLDVYLGPMFKGLEYLLNVGLHEAIQKREDLAERANKYITKRLIELGRSENDFADEIGEPRITPDMIYSKTCYDQIPLLKEFYDRFVEKQYTMTEPDTPLRFDTGQDSQRITVRDTQLLVEQINADFAKVGGSGNRIASFGFGGHDGFIEHIENGSWAGTAEVDNRRRHNCRKGRNGASLHFTQKAWDDAAGRYIYIHGDVRPPNRTSEKDYMKVMRPGIQEAMFQHGKILEEEIKESDLNPKTTKTLVDVVKGIADPEKIEDKDHVGSSAQMMGMEQNTKKAFDIEDAPLLASTVVLGRLGVKLRQNVCEFFMAAVKGRSPDSEDVRELKTIIQDTFGISKEIATRILGYDRTIVTDWHDKARKSWVLENDDVAKKPEEMLKNLNLSYGKTYFGGKSVFRFSTGDDNIRLSGVINHGQEYAKNLLKNGRTAEDLIEEFAGEDIRNEKLGVATVKQVVPDFERLVEGRVKTIRYEFDGTDRDFAFGATVKPDQTLTPEDVQNFIDQKYVFIPSGKSSARDVNKKAYNFRDYTSGILRYQNHEIRIKRSNRKGDFKATYVTNSPGRANTNAKASVLIFGKDYKNQFAQRYGTNTSGENIKAIEREKEETKEIMKSHEANPKDYGYGLGGTITSKMRSEHPGVNDAVLHFMRDDFINKAVYGINKISPGKYKKQVGVRESRKDITLQDRQSLGYLHFTLAVSKFSELRLRYGNPNIFEHHGDKVLEYLQSDHKDFPGIDDIESADFWLERLKHVLETTGRFSIVDSDDFDPINYDDNADNDPKAKTSLVPVKVHNAYLAAGAWARAIDSLGDLIREDTKGDRRDTGNSQETDDDGNEISSVDTAADLRYGDDEDEGNPDGVGKSSVGDRGKFQNPNNSRLFSRINVSKTTGRIEDDQMGSLSYSSSISDVVIVNQFRDYHKTNIKGDDKVMGRYERTYRVHSEKYRSQDKIKNIGLDPFQLATDSAFREEAQAKVAALSAYGVAFLINRHNEWFPANTRMSVLSKSEITDEKIKAAYKTFVEKTIPYLMKSVLSCKQTFADLEDPIFDKFDALCTQAMTPDLFNFCMDVAAKSGLAKPTGKKRDVVLKKTSFVATPGGASGQKIAPQARTISTANARATMGKDDGSPVGLLSRMRKNRKEEPKNESFQTRLYKRLAEEARKT